MTVSWNLNISRRDIYWSITLLFTFIFLFYYNVLISLVNIWVVDSNYSHGFIIPVVTSYIIWTKRKSLQTAIISPSLWGIVILGFGLFLLICGRVGNIVFFTRVSFIFVIIGSVLFVYGDQITRVILFPVCYLLLMIPLPGVLYNDLTFRLRLLSTTLSVHMIRIFSVPVYREGNILHFANTSLQVVDACSGMRSLISLLAIGLILSYFSQRTFFKRLILTAFTLPIAIFANSVRLTTTAVLSHYFGSNLAEGFFHSYSGIFVFLIASLLLVVCASILRRT